MARQPGRRWRRGCRWAAAATALAAVLAPGAAHAQQDPAQQPAVAADFPATAGPALADIPSVYRFDKLNPGRAPAGSNDFGCAPTPERPYPVLLAHGTDASAYGDYAVLAPYLKARGLCVFAVNYGAGVGKTDLSAAGAGGGPTYGTGDLRRSAREVSDAVARVRAATGAAKVHLVGFSQGANVTRYYVNRLGGAAATATWTGIGSPTYGGQFFGVAGLVGAVPAAGQAVGEVLDTALVQELEGSEFLADLNAGGDTVPGVRYTTVSSRFDEVVHPADNMPLRGPGAVNLVVQDLCPQDNTGHFGLTYSPTVLQLVHQAVDPAAPPLACLPVPFGVRFVETVVGANS